MSVLYTFAALQLAIGETSLRRPPNIIFVLADDLGFAELGCYGNTFNETPHLDQLSREGMRFTQAYAAAPVCSPTRAALLTGLHPARIGILDYLRPDASKALEPSHLTLPEVLLKNGYKTGMIGKWHLTGYTYHGATRELGPEEHGFEWVFGREVKSVGNGANFWPYVFRDQPIRWIDIPDNRLGAHEYLTDRLNIEAIDFIERNRDQPFFLYLSHYAPHTILNGRSDLVAKYKAKRDPGPSSRERCYLCLDAGLGGGDPDHHWARHHNPHLAAMLESIDQGVGRLMNKLDELELASNTILIFTSDNGGETKVTSNTPLRGGKSQLYEGGIRVPLIIRWPRSIPSGSLCHQATHTTDFYPTLLAATHLQAPPGIPLDGKATLETWFNPRHPIKRDFLAWHYPLKRPHFLGGVSAGAIRSDFWKLIENYETNKLELYALDQDPGETNNLAIARPAIATRLHQKLIRWRDEITSD